MNKRLIWIFAFILLAVPLVSGALGDDLKMYYTFDNTELVGLTSIDIMNISNATNDNTVVTGDLGVVNEGYYFGADSYVDLNEGADFFRGATDNLTVSFWINTTKTGDYRFGSNSGGSATYFVIQLNQDDSGARSGYIRVIARGGAICRFDTDGDTKFNNGSWHMLTVTMNTDCSLGYQKIYIDNTSVAITTTDNGDATSLTLVDWYVGAQNNAGAESFQYDGHLDEVAIFDNTLDQTKINQLYTNGVFNRISAPPNNPPVINGLTVVNASDNKLISNIQTTNLFLTNETVYLNASVTDADGDNFNITFLAYDPDSVIVINETLLNRSNGIYNTSNNFTLSKLGNYTINITATDGTDIASTEYSFAVKYAIINVTATDILGGGSITTFNVSIDGRTVATTNGTAYIMSDYGLGKTLSIVSENFIANSTLVNVNDTDMKYVNFNVYTQNTIDFEFKDEMNNQYINNTLIQLELISEAIAYNFSTTNATITAKLLSPQEYTIRTNIAGYVQNRNYIFELIDQTYSTITIYMLNNTNSVNVTVAVYEGGLTPIESAVVKVLKYQPSTNTYVIVEIISTNSQGLGTIHITRDEFYRFIVEKPAGTQWLFTNPAYILGDTLILSIQTTDPPMVDYFKAYDVIGSLTFNEVTGNFRFEFNDAYNTVSKGCLEIYRLYNGAKTKTNSSCSVSSAGVVLIGVTNVTGAEYEAQGYIYFDEEKWLLKSLAYKFLDSNVLGAFPLLLMLFLTITVIGLGLWRITVGIMLAPLPLLMGAMLGILPFSVTLLVGLQVVAIILAFVIARRNV